MVDLIPIRKLYVYEKLEQINAPEGRVYGDDRLPSVTRILSATKDRAHRIGQTKNVTYIDLIAVGTVDEKIVKALRDKINIATQVMGEDFKQWLI